MITKFFAFLLLLLLSLILTGCGSPGYMKYCCKFPYVPIKKRKFTQKICINYDVLWPIIIKSLQQTLDFIKKDLENETGKNVKYIIYQKNKDIGVVLFKFINVPCRYVSKHDVYADVFGIISTKTRENCLLIRIKTEIRTIEKSDKSEALFFSNGKLEELFFKNLNNNIQKMTLSVLREL